MPWVDCTDGISSDCEGEVCISAPDPEREPICRPCWRLRADALASNANETNPES